MVNSGRMRIPPADLGYLRDQFNELAAQIQEHWESSALAESETDSPGMLGDAMTQLIDMLGPLDRSEDGIEPKRAEIKSLALAWLEQGDCHDVRHLKKRLIEGAA